MRSAWLSEDRKALLRQLQQRKGLGGAVPRIEARPDPTAPAPLSHGQRRLWFFDRLQPGSALYNVAGGVRFRGALDRGALRRALTAILTRHEVLRTTYRADDTGGAVAVVGPVPPVELPVSDVDDVMAEARRLAVEPFDLATGPVLRAHLLRVAADDHLLVLNVHHIACDGWSLEVLLRELVACYGDPEAPLAELPVQYADYAAWQQEWLASPAGDAQLAHWRDRLAGAPLLEVPADRARPAEPGFAGGAHTFSLTPETGRALTALAEAERTTPFVVALTAFAAVLGRWAGQEDLVIGMPVAGRSRAEVAPLVGFFVNTLPLRLDLSGDPTVRDLLRQVRSAVLDARSNADIPFDHLVEKLRPARDAGGRTPLVRHLFQTDEAPFQRVTAGAVELEVVPLTTGTAKFDLNVDLTPLPDGGWTGQVEHSRELYADETAARLTDSLRLVLSALEPELPVSRLPLLTDEHRAEVVDRLSGASVPALRSGPVTLHGHVEAQVDATPDAEAVRFEDTAISYAELDRRANQLAHLLRSRGVGPDTVVGVCLPRSIELLVALVAVLKAGGAYLPLETGYPAARLELMLADARAAVVIGDSTSSTVDGVELICPQRDAALIAAQPQTRPAVEVSERDLAYVIFTSGSTGRPKGAMNEHRGALNRILWMHQAFPIEPGEGVLQKTPIGFDVSVWELFWPLMVGARVVLARPGGHGDPDYLAGLIESASITTAHFVPSMLAAFLTAPGLARAGALRRIVCSGEELPASLVDDCARLLPDVPVFNLYGPTEAAIDVTWYDCRDGYGHRVPIGFPVDGARIHLVDEHLAPVPAGMPGELLIGGVPVCRGYRDRPALTASRFIPDPFGAPGERLYRTGDLARRRPDGAVEYLGRIDDQVKLRGMRIELGEIEAALTALPGVDSAVAGLHTAHTGPRLAAWLRASPEPDLGRVRAALREKLPAHMVPTDLVLVDEWPLSPNGKLDRRRLPEPAAADVEGEHVPPADDTERALVRLWQEVLGVARVGTTDNFFDLGGHSLLATQIVLRVRSAFGVELPLNKLFASPTVAAMAQAVREGARRPASGPGLRRVDRSRFRAPVPPTVPQELTP
ncbi:amino acid adenylation domain-containing protein [Saccharopolyspora indica]|uniref:amino acid adenylation domain-containing protein n=1 Tax=Saccharopolyspora indica TaxID=1229659 RepID=UPI0022EAE398|nr:amino acid adenylation domain-containing protein [Saccharopolyspora indica]MDA3650053.1 amino acid adenylation domain-containing protein [Saccharopolyspora indica]